MPFQSGTNDISAEARIGYQNSFNQAIQQNDERFAGMSIVLDDWTENQYVATEIEQQEWITNNARFGQTNPTEVEYGDRSGFMQKCEWERILDKWDPKLLDGLGDPTNAILAGAAMGLRRKRDDIFIEALLADSIGGEFPHQTTMSFPAANTVAVGFVPRGINAGGTTALGLTPGKILEAKRLMGVADALDVGGLFLALTPTQVDDLEQYSQTYKNDPWASRISKWLDDPSAPLLGCTPIVTNRLPTTDAGVRSCVLFAREAMRSSNFDSKPYMSVRDDLKYALQLANYGRWGVFRLYDEMVYEILCDEDTTPSGTLATTY
jgi:hypothetical protein